jgi:toxin ParE1/3/4
MTRHAVVLDGAKADFREIKGNVKKNFGDLVWATVNQEFKNAVQHITTHPLSGARIEELGQLGCDNYRQTLVRQTRVVYEFDRERVIIHFFIHTRRDFKTQLEKRLLAP